MNPPSGQNTCNEIEKFLGRDNVTIRLIWNGDEKLDDNDSELGCLMEEMPEFSKFEVNVLELDLNKSLHVPVLKIFGPKSIVPTVPPKLEMTQVPEVIQEGPVEEINVLNIPIVIRNVVELNFGECLTVPLQNCFVESPRDRVKVTDEALERVLTVDKGSPFEEMTETEASRVDS
jgi:hypothetical protein